MRTRPTQLDRLITKATKKYDYYQVIESNQGQGYVDI